MKTRIQVESFLGDSYKVIAHQIDELMEIDRLQCDEILAFIEGRVLSLKTPRAYKQRPKPSKAFEKTYNSGNLYTLTVSMTEKCASDRLDVIEAMAKQIISHDKLSKEDVVRGCDSYIRSHLSDGEDAPDLPHSPPKE